MNRLALGAILLALVPCVATAQVVERYVGPNFPILVDTSGDGLPTPGVDTGIVPTLAGDTMTIPNPWEGCGAATHNVVQLTRPPVIVAVPPYNGGNRTTENQTESIVADEIEGGRPVHFAMNVDKPGFPDKNGTAEVVDDNLDGVYDAFEGAGDGGINFSLDILLADVSADGFDDYASIPWAQASALGVETGDGCLVSGGDPQIWIPLADTNDDGQPDSIVLDLDGNNVPDPDFLFGPVIAGAGVAPADNSIPTLSQWALLLASLALAATAWVQIRRISL